jgi:hypothetical protein
MQSAQKVGKLKFTTTTQNMTDNNEVEEDGHDHKNPIRS